MKPDGQQKGPQRQPPRWFRWRTLVTLSVGVLAVFLSVHFGLVHTEEWTRQYPLKNPVIVRAVQGGVVQLADGRTFRPAGVRLKSGRTISQLDDALRIATAQGVVVDRDLGDGRAFLTVEPKFFNWCGTLGFNGLWWSHWAGGYFQCPLSAVLIYAGYTEPSLEEAGLTPKDRWRLVGVDQFRQEDPPRIGISDERQAFRFNAGIARFQNLDEWLKLQSAPPSD